MDGQLGRAGLGIIEGKAKEDKAGLRMEEKENRHKRSEGIRAKPTV